MCIKIDNRMGCYDCGYPDSEAAVLENPLIRCDDSQFTYERIYRLSLVIKGDCKTIQRDAAALGADQATVDSFDYNIVINDIAKAIV